MIRTVAFTAEFARSWRRRFLMFAALAVLSTTGVAQDPPAEPAKPAASAPAADDAEEAELVVQLGANDREKKQKLDRYREIVNKGSLSGEDERKLLGEVVRWKMARFTLKKNRQPPVMKKNERTEKLEPADAEWMPLHKIRENILDDLKKPLGGGRDVRPELLKAIVKEAAGLLEGYHFAARMNVAILLYEITAVPDTNQPYIPAYQLLIKIARDTKQFDAVRIHGVIGCQKLLKFNQTPAEVRSAVVKNLVELLSEQNKGCKEEKVAHDWLNSRVVEALGWSQMTTVERKAVVPEVLAQVIIDTEHPWRPRYYAAQAVGRLPLDGTINLQMISVEIARLAQQVAREYKKNKAEPQWKIAAWRIYFAFRPEEDVDKAQQAGLKTQVDGKAALGAVKKPVTEAYEAVLPIINGILRGEDLPNPAVEKLNKWLIDNTPKDFKVYPNAEPLALPPDHAKVAQAPAPGNTGN